MKTAIKILLILCLGYLPLGADDGGDVNLVLQDYITKYENATTVQQKALLLHRIIVESSFSNLDMSKSYAHELKKLADSSGSPIALVRYYNVKGIISFTELVPLDSMLYWYNMASKTIKENKVNDLDLEISLYNNRAIAYMVSDMTNKAINEYREGLKILENSKEKLYNLETVLYANISNMMMNAKRYDEALEYILKAEESNNIQEKIDKKHTGNYEYILGTKGEVLYHLEKYDEAEKTLEAIITNNNKLDVANNFGNIMLGTVYAKNGKIELARRTLKLGLKDAIKLNIGIENQVYASLSLAKLELKEFNPTSSLLHMDYIFGLFAKEDKEPDDSEIYKTMAEVLEQSGRFEESLFYSKEHQIFQEKEIVKENSIKYGELEHQLSDIEKQYEINKLENREKLHSSRLSMLLFAFILCVLLMLILFSMYVKKEEHNKTLIRVNKEITLAKDTALAAAKAKENFLATMSHEMRTPMNAVIGLTDIMLDEDPNPKHIEHLNTLKFSGEGLLNIINEVLDFSKIEASKLEIRKRDLNLQHLLNNMVKSIAHGNLNSNVRVLQDQQLTELHHLVSGDEKRISQILTNLLGNAIKFTNEGHIILRSYILENKKEVIKVKFQIEDSGIGIPKAKLESIFESFSQVNNEINRSHQGTGLGLAISKRLVELQGGVIDVKSEEGRGTTFSFILEFDKKTLVQKIQPSSPTSKIYQTGIEGRKILLVEDNKLNQLVALKVLKKFKVEASLAQNGKEAVEMVEAGDFDLVLMDIHMPIMDGIEATINIRALQNESKSQIPIIALSADAYSDKVKAATECGMNDYLSKPFKPHDLFQKIQSNLDPTWIRGTQA